MTLSTRLCGFMGSFGIADALAQIQGANQALTPRSDVHHRAAREIERRNLAAEERIQQAALAPHHVRHREIHDESTTEQVNSSIALNFIRSAKAPEISAGVMMANISW